MDERDFDAFNQRRIAVVRPEPVAPPRRRSAETQTRPVAVVAPRWPDCSDESTYVLRGFGCSFLEMRPIMFAYPLPRYRVCILCKVVSARSWVLRCGHALCNVCIGGLQTGQDVQRKDVEAVPGRERVACPADGLRFTDHEVLSLAYSLEQVGCELVRCVNARSGCPFVAELKYLKEHCTRSCRFRLGFDSSYGRHVPGPFIARYPMRWLQYLRP